MRSMTAHQMDHTMKAMEELHTVNFSLALPRRRNHPVTFCESSQMEIKIKG